MEIKSIEAFASYVEQGKVIAYPTETVWGLGASIYQPSAIKKIFEIKGLAKHQPLSVLVRDVEAAKKLVMLNQKEKLLLKCFWPGPASFIFPALDKDLALNLGSSDGSLCLRCSDHGWVKQFTLLCDSPIVSTIVNRSSDSLAQSSSDLSWLPSDVEVVNWQDNMPGKLPSTVLKAKGDDIKVIREGAWPISQLKPLLQKLGYTTS